MPDTLVITTKVSLLTPLLLALCLWFGNESIGQTVGRGALTVQIINWKGLEGQSGPPQLATDLHVSH